MTRHSHNLCEALKLQNNLARYHIIKRKLLQISRTKLDIIKPWTMQNSETINAIIKEIEATWPDFFSEKDNEGGHAIKCALAYMQQIHSADRYKVFSKKAASVHPPVRRGQKKTKSIAKSPLKREPLVEKPLSPTENTQTPLVERTTCNLEYSSSHSETKSSGPTEPAPQKDQRGIVFPVTSQSNHKSATNRTPLPTRLGIRAKTQPSQSLSEGVATSSSDPTSSPVASTGQSCSFRQDSARASMPTSSALQINIPAIHTFLRTCLPSMDHFLYRFINAGMRTEEGLLAASRWPQELIVTFLDQLPPNPDGTPVLLMERMVLMHQFATYFL